MLVGLTLPLFASIVAASTTTHTTTTTHTSTHTNTHTSTHTSTPSPPIKPNYWFSFGDSYTTTSFNVTTGPLPSLDNPLGNPPYPGWTGGSGQNWVDALTTIYNRSHILTYNFAYGGATINASLVTPYLPTVLSLGDQVNEFKASVAKHPASTPWTSADTLFSVWIGINDIGNSFYLDGDRSAFSDVLLDNYFALVEELYRAGGRNFLFVNVPPIQSSPLMLAQPVASQITEAAVIAVFNKKLAARVNGFRAKNFGVKTWLFDSYKAFSVVLANPTKYGFIDNTSYTGDADDFWGNSYHPSAKFQTLLGKEIGDLLKNTVW